MAPADTRERILDAAERLFAHSGISATSLRAVTREAGVNLAAVHYHFGSKQALLDAVIERRVSPINALRLDALDAIEREARSQNGRTGPEAETILRAFFLPVLRGAPDLGCDSRRETLSRLLARVEAQPPREIERMHRRHMAEVSARFVVALQRSLPSLPAEQVAHRFRYATGVLNQLLSGVLDLDTVPGHPPSPAPLEQRIEEAIAFATAGLCTPACAQAGVADASLSPTCPDERAPEAATR